MLIGLARLAAAACLAAATDLGAQASRYTGEHPALQDVGFWATKRSPLSAEL